MLRAVYSDKIRPPQDPQWPPWSKQETISCMRNPNTCMYPLTLFSLDAALEGAYATYAYHAARDIQHPRSLQKI